jgi:hypothetical protein
MLHTLHLHVALTIKTNERNLGTFQKAMLFRNRAELERKLFLVFYFLLPAFNEQRLVSL